MTKRFEIHIVTNIKGHKDKHFEREQMKKIISVDFKDENCKVPPLC